VGITSTEALYTEGNISFGTLEGPAKVFAQFTFAAVITRNSAVIVARSDSKITGLLDLPLDCVSHSVYPVGAAGVCVLSDAGQLFCYADISAKPSIYFEKVVSVASTRSRTFILKSDGRIYEMVQGQLVQFSGIDALPVKLFSGGAHAGCVTFDGRAFTWGCGLQGQLGNGKYVNSSVPTEVILPVGHRITDAVAGEEHTVFTIVNERDFSCIVPKIMLREPVPAGIVALSAIPFAFTPPEIDIKF
jgi:hypothetical protein